MISRREIDGAIQQFENAPVSYQNCEKLATFYTILDHIDREEPQHSYDTEPVSGDSEFMQAVSAVGSEKAWSIMDELMQTVLVTNPRLYTGVMRKLKE